MAKKTKTSAATTANNDGTAKEKQNIHQEVKTYLLGKYDFRRNTKTNKVEVSFKGSDKWNVANYGAILIDLNADHAEIKYNEKKIAALLETENFPIENYTPEDKTATDTPNNSYNEPQQIKVERYLNDNYDFRWNTVQKDCFYKAKGEDETCYQKINIPSLWRELQRKGFKYSASNLECTLGSDFVEQYDPIKEFFETLPKWDGNDYIRQLCSHIVLVEETDSEIERLNIMFQKWLVRCVRCALGGRLNREVIMFKSDRQKVGKSEFFRHLTRSTRLSDYYMENPEIGNKDALISLTENIIINFDEYDTYLKEGNLPTLKSYISQESPKVRVPYAKKQEKYQRISSFVATTNIPDFLRDETGNTRFICFDIDGIDWRAYTKIDVKLVWAQAYHYYNQFIKGEYQCDMTNEEEKANDLNNLKYLYHTTEYELIQKLFEPSTNPNDFMTATDIADYLHDNTRYKAANSRGVGRALTGLGYKRVHSKIDNAKQGYQIRPKQPTNQLFTT